MAGAHIRSDMTPWSSSHDRHKLVDAHVHLWDTARLSYPWLDQALELMRRADASRFRQACAELGDEAAVTAAVVVQAECHPDQAFDELDLIRSEQAAGAPVAAVVAYAPLEKRGAAAALERLAKIPQVRGVRRNIQDEASGFSRAPGPEGWRRWPISG